MKPITIDLLVSDFSLIKAKSPCSIYFFQKCKIKEYDDTYSFPSVSITFKTDRFTRRALTSMLKDLVQEIYLNDEHSEQLCEIVYLFLFHLG